MNCSVPLIFPIVVDTAVQAAYQASKEKEQQLLVELDTIKDQLISSLKEELQTKQEKITSLSDQLDQRENGMLEQKGITLLFLIHREIKMFYLLTTPDGSAHNDSDV